MSLFAKRRLRKAEQKLFHARSHQPLPLLRDLSASQFASNIVQYASVRDVLTVVDKLSVLLPVKAEEVTVNHFGLQQLSQASKMWGTILPSMRRWEDKSGCDIVARSIFLMWLEDNHLSYLMFTSNQTKVMIPLDQLGWYNGVRFMLAVINYGIQTKQPINHDALFSEALSMGADDKSVDYTISVLDQLIDGIPGGALLVSKGHGIDRNLLDALVVGGSS